MRVGFAGLGAMGSGIVRRLLAAGRGVAGWNRTRAKAEPLLAEGMTWAETPRELAAGADVVITMLTDAPAVRAALEGEDGILAGIRAGAVLLDLSTIAPEESRALAALVAERGATMLDAPVSGSLATLAEGQMAVMVGGPREAFERVLPLLREIGPKVTHVGDNGHALVVKLAINLSLVVQVVSFCESVAMAEKAGIAPAAAVDAILKSVIASPVLGYRGPCILEQPETPFADVTLQQKDQQLGLGLARSLGAAVPFAALANELLTATRAAGLGDRDFSAVYEVFRSMGGIE